MKTIKMREKKSNGELLIIKLNIWIINIRWLIRAIWIPNLSKAEQNPTIQIQTCLVFGSLLCWRKRSCIQMITVKRLKKWIPKIQQPDTLIILTRPLNTTLVHLTREIQTFNFSNTFSVRFSNGLIMWFGSWITIILVYKTGIFCPVFRQLFENWTIDNRTCFDF